MTPQTVFVSMTDEQISEMSLSLIAGTITREDYHRLCCWLDYGIRMADYVTGDATIELLKSLEGRVTHTQRELLKAAMNKWIGVIQTFILDEENNAHAVASNPFQMSIDFGEERRARAVVEQVLGYGNTPVTPVKKTKRVKVTASVHRYFETLAGSRRTTHEKRVAIDTTKRIAIKYTFRYRYFVDKNTTLWAKSRHSRHVIYSDAGRFVWRTLSGTGGL